MVSFLQMLEAVHMLKKVVTGGLLLAAAIGLCGFELAAAAGPAPAKKAVDGSRISDNQTMMVDDLFSRVIEIAGGAASVDDLQVLLENDPLVQEAGLIPGSDIMVSSLNTGDCRLSPLLCLFKSSTPDLRCIYDCIGLRGTGELISRHQEECVFLAGCILFESCLALCISIIPYDLQPVIWW